MIAPHWWPAYIGIGSNLESPEGQVTAAMKAIGGLPDTQLVSRSALYRSAPMGPADQPDFVNAVVALMTRSSARQLLQNLQEIERQQGRVRDGARWGPRTLDLDLLAYSDQVTDAEGLTLPYPGIAQRNFVLLPWQEIAAHFRLPGGGDIAGLAAAVSLTEPRIERIG